MNWIFKQEYVKFYDDFETATITIIQNGNFKGKEGDSVLIYDKMDNEWIFLYHYKIVKVIIRETENDKKNNTIELNLIEKYKDEKPLSDYVYSIERIKNYTNLSTHFRRKYNKLSDLEFNAIDKDEIYYTRTILGTIFNSLHKDHQEQYLFYLAENNPILLTDSTDLSANLKLLTEYVKFAILKPARYLIESDKILHNILTQEEINQIAFANPDFESNKNIQLIHPQVSLINAYLPQITDKGDLQINTEPYEFDENNSKYLKKFKNAGLPFKLK